MRANGPIRTTRRVGHPSSWLLHHPTDAFVRWALTPEDHFARGVLLDLDAAVHGPPFRDRDYGPNLPEQWLLGYNFSVAV